VSSGDPLLQPFKLKHLTLRNRIMSPAHEPAYAEDGKPKLRYQLYQEEKAKGGIALSMFGGSTNVAPDSPPVFGQLYASSGSPLGLEFRANTTTANEQSASSVAANAAGNFVVVWNADTQDGSSFGVFGQRYLPILPVELLHFRVE